MTGVLKYTEKVREQKRMTADFNVRKIHSDAERMDDCEHSLEIIIVPLKERIAETNFFWK